MGLRSQDDKTWTSSGVTITHWGRKWGFQQWLKWGFELFTGLNDLCGSLLEECVENNPEDRPGRQGLLWTSPPFCTRRCRLSHLLSGVASITWCRGDCPILWGGRITGPLVLRCIERECTADHILERMLEGLMPNPASPWPWSRSFSLEELTIGKFDFRAFTLQVVFQECVCILRPQWD